MKIDANAYISFVHLTKAEQQRWHETKKTTTVMIHFCLSISSFLYTLWKRWFLPHCRKWKTLTSRKKNDFWSADHLLHYKGLLSTSQASRIQACQTINSRKWILIILSKWFFTTAYSKIAHYSYTDQPHSVFRNLDVYWFIEMRVCTYHKMIFIEIDDACMFTYKELYLTSLTL